MDPLDLLGTALGLLLGPMLLGLIGRTKALLAGRRGPPLLQPYFDIAKLLRKGVVLSTTTTAVFRIAPTVALAASVGVLLLIPLGPLDGPLAMVGDLLLLAGLLVVVRLCLVFGALDTGSAFEGLGASRELLYGALLEPTVLLALLALLVQGGVLSISDALPAAALWAGGTAGTALLLVLCALVFVLLVESARLPFDDPATHLELTMVHEVLVLDHSGPDLAFLEYGRAVRLWAIGALLVGVVVPSVTGSWLLGVLLTIVGLVVLSVGIGVLESTLARLRQVRVPTMLLGASALTLVALVILVR